MLQAADLTIRLNPADDVVIARVDLPAGTEILKENIRVSVNVPAGHKVATKDLNEGAAVRRYNQIIGFSTRPIRAGEHVHVHNLAMGSFDRDYAFCVDYKPTQFAASPASLKSDFMVAYLQHGTLGICLLPGLLLRVASPGSCMNTSTRHARFVKSC